MARSLGQIVGEFSAMDGDALRSRTQQPTAFRPRRYLKWRLILRPTLFRVLLLARSAKRLALSLFGKARRPLRREVFLTVETIL